MTHIEKIRTRCKEAMEKSLDHAGCSIAAKEDIPWLLAQTEVMADLLRQSKRPSGRTTMWFESVNIVLAKVEAPCSPPSK